METLIDKLKGTIYGQAIGDALGLGTEGMTDEDMAWKYPNGIPTIAIFFKTVIAEDGKLAIGQMTRI